MYAFPLAVLGKGPTRSIEITSQGSWGWIGKGGNGAGIPDSGTEVDSVEETLFEESFIGFWVEHFGHFLIWKMHRQFIICLCVICFYFSNIMITINFMVTYNKKTQFKIFTWNWDWL